MSSFDCIVITASNETQATGYRAQVAPMQGVLAPEIIVVPDPDGRRVGSLGSTVALLKNLGPRLVEKRVLVCHSGGDSKRLPAYAAIGKAFVPVPQGDGSVKSLFEVIVGNMSQLKLPKAGLLVVCGDVAPRFNYSACRFGRRGVTGVGYRASKEGKKLVLNIGYSHQVDVEEIDGITIDVPNPNTVVVNGIDKQVVGQFAADIRAKRPPEPYKGKGIKYVDEYVRRKEGKTGAK